MTTMSCLSVIKHKPTIKNTEVEVPCTISTTHQKHIPKLFCLVNLQSCLTLTEAGEQTFYSTGTSYLCSFCFSNLTP